MFCERCGSKVSEGAAFCSVCGEPVRGKNINPVVAVHQTTPAVQQTGIQRNALLAYLERVRDLEIARDNAYSILNNATNTANNEIFQAGKLQARKEYPEKPMLLLSIFVGLMSGLMVGLALFFLIVLFVGLDNAFMLGATIAGLIFIISIIVGLAKSESYKKDCADIDSENIEIDKVNRERQNNAELLKAAWTKKLNAMQSECDRIDKLLKDFYSVNLIDKDLRNLECACYIHRMMSSSTVLTFNEVILHAHIHEEVNRMIQEIRNAADQICATIADEGMKIRRQQEMHNSRIESQNMKILKAAQQTAANTEEQANYQRMLTCEQEYTNWLLTTDLLGMWK